MGGMAPSPSRCGIPPAIAPPAPFRRSSHRRRCRGGSRHWADISAAPATPGASTMPSRLIGDGARFADFLVDMAMPINSWPNNFAPTCSSTPAGRRQSRLSFVVRAAMTTAITSYQPYMEDHMRWHAARLKFLSTASQSMRLSIDDQALSERVTKQSASLPTSCLVLLTDRTRPSVRLRQGAADC